MKLKVGDVVRFIAQDTSPLSEGGTIERGQLGVVVELFNDTGATYIRWFHQPEKRSLWWFNERNWHEYVERMTDDTA